MFPRDMYSLEVEIVSQGTEGKIPNQVHNLATLDFRELITSTTPKLSQWNLMRLDVHLCPQKWQATTIANNSCQRMLMPRDPNC